MGTVVFEGEAPFELATRSLPTATPEGDTVVLNLPVFADGFPRQMCNIQVTLMLEHAVQLAAQMQPAVTMARARHRGR